MFFNMKNCNSRADCHITIEQSHNITRDSDYAHSTLFRKYPHNYRMVWIALVLILLIILAEMTGSLYYSVQREQNQMLWGEEKKNISILGTVIESKKGQSYIFVKTNEGIPIYVTLPYELFDITTQNPTVWYPTGTKLQIQGMLSLPEHARNPGGFDEAAWLRSKETGLVLHGETIQLITEPKGIWRLVYNLHEYIERILYQTLEEEHANLAMALLTGEKHRINEMFYNMTQQMGIAHIFAVSGLHVGIIGSVLLFFFRKMGWIQSWISFILLAIGLSIYCMLVGLSASVIRATGMILLSALAMRLYRPIESVNFLAFAAIVLLLENPFLLWNTGFQLSFGVTLSLLLFVQPIQKMMNRIPISWMRSSVAVVLAAWIGSIPLTAWHFYTFTPISPMFNLILVPLVSITVPLLLMAIFFTSIFPTGAEIWFLPTKLLLFCLEHGTIWFYKITENLFYKVQWNIGRPDIIAFMLYVLLIILLWYWLHNKQWMQNQFVTAFLLLLFFIVIAICIPTAANEDELLYLDTGQGSCALLRTKSGEVVLFDAGNQKQELASVLAWYGINHIDAVIISHSDTDHINGLAKVIQTVRIEQILMETNQMERDIILDVLTLAKEKCIDCRAIMEKSTLYLSNHTIGLQPLMDYTNSSNATELTAILHYGNHAVAFPGDMSISAVQKFVVMQDTITIWTVPHHGSRFSGNDGLYQMLKEKGVQYAVISSGQDNHYGHPHQEVLEWLETYQIDYYNTAERGAILLILD